MSTLKLSEIPCANCGKRPIRYTLAFIDLVPIRKKTTSKAKNVGQRRRVHYCQDCGHKLLESKKHRMAA